MLGSKSLYSALRNHVRFYQLVSDYVGWELVIDKEQVTLVLALKEKDNKIHPVIHYGCLYLFHRFMSWLIDYPIPLFQTHFAYPDPGYDSEYQFMFPGPRKFEQARTSLTFPASHLSMPIVKDEELLLQLFQTQMEPLFRLHYVPQNIVSKIRALLQKKSSFLNSLR